MAAPAYTGVAPRGSHRLQIVLFEDSRFLIFADVPGGPGCPGGPGFPGGTILIFAYVRERVHRQIVYVQIFGLTWTKGMCKYLGLQALKAHFT